MPSELLIPRLGMERKTEATYIQLAPSGRNVRDVAFQLENH